MKKFAILFLALFLPIFIITLLGIQDDEDEIGLPEKKIKLQNYVFKADRQVGEVVDHSRFEELQQEFENAHKVTEACLGCHNERHHEIMKTPHWNWERDEVLEGKGVISLGKKNILNNFCIGISGSEQTCTRCHIGYGWSDKSFDFNEPTNIDCLVCHDQTDTYEKGQGAAGYPAAHVDLAYVARNVGSPRKENCGVCHFWGGGGNNVKHGDLDKAMLDCSREIECHVTEHHNLTGKLYALSSENKNRVTCEQCHTEKPHDDQILNDHICRIACQTCHIPYYAKAGATKMIWDWSTAGELDEHGHPKHEDDAYGNHKYLAIKGTFIWDDHVVPEYYWFNGIANHQLIEDKIESIPVQMNSLDGAYMDKGLCKKSIQPSKIWPVKVHRGKQVYDTVHKTLIQPKLYAPRKGEGAYWKDFDWIEASQQGMDYVGLPFSGHYDFVETEMYWPLNHQVAPKEQSLQCADCHTREGGRLASLKDFYLPGRDYKAGVEIFGILLIAFSILGVMVHATCRVISGRKCKMNKYLNN
ncbi:MAG: tetrathionate reductase family octaheme c-type cytochrome [Bacteroidales bacterium]